jgi:hypothetical protein
VASAGAGDDTNKAQTEQTVLIQLSAAGLTAAGLTTDDTKDAIRLLDQRWDNYFGPEN